MMAHSKAHRSTANRGNIPVLQAHRLDLAVLHYDSAGCRHARQLDPNRCPEQRSTTQIVLLVIGNHLLKGVCEDEEGVACGSFAVRHRSKAVRSSTAV